MALVYEPPFKLQGATATTGTLTTKAFEVSRFTTIGIQVNTSSASTLTSTIKLQVTIDGVNWGDYSGSSTTVSADGVTNFSIAEYAFVAVRVVAAVTVGSAVFEVWAMAKQS